MTCNEFLNNNFVEITRTKSDFTFLGEHISSENKGYDAECSDEKREREERGWRPRALEPRNGAVSLGKTRKNKRNRKVYRSAEINDPKYSVEMKLHGDSRGKGGDCFLWKNQQKGKHTHLVSPGIQRYPGSACAAGLNPQNEAGTLVPRVTLTR